jgi:succinate dehydrogenase/fumarate reductase flavoprotein subunit
MTSPRVLIIGAGLAGMTATVAAQQEGAEVVLIDRGGIGLGSNSAMANGVFAGPSSAYSEEEYVRDTLEIGKGINHEPYVRLVAREAVGAFGFLRSLGVNLVENSRGIYVPAVGKPDVPRGVTIVRALRERIRGLERVKVITGFQVAALVRDGERVYGVKGWDRLGREVTVRGSAVILATGGAGAVYLRNDNQKSTMGQGFLLAAKAGLELWDMEFVQFYPFVIAEPHLPSVMLYPPYPREARLLDGRGSDLGEKHGLQDLDTAIRRRRDELAAIIVREGLAGPVRMDLTRVPPVAWDDYPLSLLGRMNFDFRRYPVTISPAAHFFMGGVRIHENAETDAPGLFACGEVVWGLHGANRRGGNALTECVVTGRMAGRESAQRSTLEKVVSAVQERPGERWAASQTHATGELRRLRASIREVAWECAGVVRSDEGLVRGVESVREREARLREIVPGTSSERGLKEDLTSALFVVKAVLTASLDRKESRGAFCREDFPQQDDANWGASSCLAYESSTGTLVVKKRDRELRAQ